MNRSLTSQTDHLKKAPPDPGPSRTPTDLSPCDFGLGCDVNMTRKKILTFGKRYLDLVSEHLIFHVQNPVYPEPQEKSYTPGRSSLLRILSSLEKLPSLSLSLAKTGKEREHYSEDTQLVCTAASGAAERSLLQRHLPKTDRTANTRNRNELALSLSSRFGTLRCSVLDWTFQYYLWSYNIGGTFSDYWIREKALNTKEDKTVLQEAETEKLCQEKFPEETILVTVKVRVYFAFALQINSSETEMADQRRDEFFDPLECDMDLAELQARVHEAERNRREEEEQEAEDQEYLLDLDLGFQDEPEEVGGDEYLDMNLDFANDDGEDELVADYVNRASPIPPPPPQEQNVHQDQFGNIPANPPWQKQGHNNNNNDDQVVPNSLRFPNSEVRNFRRF